MKQDGQIWDVLVVGGGAAGLMAAGFAARQGAGVLVLERNARMARKLMITGKGRCNLTNDCDRDTLIAHAADKSPLPLQRLFLFVTPRSDGAVGRAWGSLEGRAGQPGLPCF